ncbi:MAG: alpha/beta fold hydrolase [Bacteroidales bacterium]
MESINSQKVYKCEYGDVHYDLSGPENKPLVIFLHGVGMDCRTFEKQREALRNRYRTLLVDLPGHGNSTIKNYNYRYSELASECLQGLLDEIGVKQAILVGQSLGSFISQRFQLKNPERVIAAVHIGGAEFKSYAGNWAKVFIPAVMGMTYLMPKKSFYNAFGRHKAETLETQEYLIEATRKSGKKLISAIVKDMLHEMTEGLPEPASRPMMICYGKSDLAFIRKNCVKWHRKTPGSVLVEIDNANHIANQDRPDEFNEALLSFLEKINNISNNMNSSKEVNFKVIRK